MITVTAFQWVPDFAQGLVRDLRVRWALEEAAIPYRQKLIANGDQDTPEFRAIQPWGQIPILEEDGVTLFESGAIVLHIAGRSEALSPSDPMGRAKTAQWVFAALNSIEPHLQNLFAVDVFYADQEWARLRRQGAYDFAKMKLASLSKRLAGREWLEDRFTAGDLMMATVLRIARDTDLVTSDPVLSAYLARCEARPAFRKALSDQLAAFAAHEPVPEPA